MESIISICIIFGIPVIFLILCIRNIVRIVKLRKDKVTIKKSLITKSIVFGVIFIFIVIFYIWIMYSLSRAVANM